MIQLKYPNRMKLLKLQFLQGQHIKVGNYKIRNGEWIRNPRYDYWLKLSTIGAFIKRESKLCDKCGKLIDIKDKFHKQEKHKKED